MAHDHRHVVVAGEFRLAFDRDLGAAFALLDREELRAAGGHGAGAGVGATGKLPEADIDAFLDGDFDAEFAGIQGARNIGPLIGKAGGISELAAVGDTEALNEDHVSAAESGDVGLGAVGVRDVEEVDLLESGRDSIGITGIGELQNGNVEPAGEGGGGSEKGDGDSGKERAHLQRLPRRPRTVQQKFMPVVETKWTASDGTMLCGKIWLPEDSPKGWVVAMHGLNCCVDDWIPLAEPLQHIGVALAAWNLRGQGRDPVIARRGAWLDVQGMIEDLSLFFDEIDPGEVPVFLAGDSMGALLALRASTAPAITRRIAGMLLFVPVVLLAQQNPPWIKGAMRFVSRIAPALRLNPSWFVHGRSQTPKLTRATERQAAFEAAPHRMHRQTLGFLADMGDLIESAFGSAGKVETPVVIFSAGHDAFVPVAAIEDFFRAIAAGDKVHYHYAESYHQLLHDLDSRRVSGDAVRWIEERL